MVKQLLAYGAFRFGGTLESIKDVEALGEGM
jgi:hypothetical protein